MTQRTSDDFIAGTLVPMYGEFDVRVFRADGSVEEKTVRNVVTKLGLNRIARRAVESSTTSAAYYLSIGTLTVAASLNAAVTSWGEVGRKASIVTGTAASSREWFFMVATWGGASDSLTGVALDAAVITDHANSGNGAPWNIAVGVGVTLQQSDVLHLTGRIRVGSHDIDNG